MMDNLVILTLMGLIWYGYIKQIYKITQNGDANGVSYQAFLLGSLAGFSIFLQAENIYIQITYLGASIMALTLTLIVLYFQKKTNYQTTENLKSLTIAGGLGIFGIYGVAQTIKLMNYQLDKKITTDITSYFAWGTGYLLGVFYFSKEPSVIAVSIISSILQFWVVYYVYTYNKKLESDQQINKSTRN